MCEIKRGKVYSKEFIKLNKGEYPVYSSQSLNDGILGKIDKYDFDGEYVTWTTDGAYAGTVFYRIGRFSITNVCGILSVLNKSKLNVKYLSTCLSMQTKKFVNKASGNPKLMSNIMENIEIPIPHISIQNKIVEILDKLEIYTKDIQSGLPLEIDQRKKQYEYYRDKLLDFKDLAGGVLSKNYLLLLNELWDKIVNIVECLSISKIFREIKTGKLNANAETPNGKYAFWTCDERPKLIDEYAFDEMAILISGNGSKVGHVNIYNGKFNAYQRTYILLKINHFVLWKYAYFYLKSNLKNYINVYKLDSGIPYITLPMLQNFVIPIPHISIQNKIVEILDKLQAYTKDIQTGLPLEIDQRKKQYEHYRDKLLNFKEKNTKI
ncbi:restriction endonuclease subunit S [Metamycoplasma hominis]|uniref:Type I restriction enzyme specificity protein n=1 Tax=Metamycoplasma hominis (strain ATCC 23114 / DSM 25592 / NBRC 14850 / NCTC 10111 / PG21) TaxID=347256 RepID=D1J8W0_METH1|nr:restriction endonuclease subunit S [Metamycoplasma hominis]CAX37657.1 Type I restriction enzyme specificity protein [Metamycoplasma hominis ATCC 23114]